MLTSCSIDFHYTALAYSNEPPGPNALLIPMDPYGIDLPFSVSAKSENIILRFAPPVFRLRFPSPVFRLFPALCAISTFSSALRALHIFSGSGFPKHGNFEQRCL